MARKRKSFLGYQDFKPTRPVETHEGIRAHSQRGAFAKNWWATRWIEALERLVDAGRLSRGRKYARDGQVLSIIETGYGIDAQVQGSRVKPYKVSILMARLTDEQWESVIDRMAEQAIFTAQLLAGEMPQEIDQVFQAAGVSLFPITRKDLLTDCSCPDMANPCKHIAATHYILGERFDEDPFLLFRLRGRSQEQILEGLRKRRAVQEEAGEEEEVETPEVFPSLEQVVSGEGGATAFWEMPASLEGFSVAIRPPAVEMPVLKRLGEPAFLPNLSSLLSRAYLEIEHTALEEASKEHNPPRI